MIDGGNRQSPLRHRQVAVDGIAIHVVEGGMAAESAVLFLHGWPESWAAFERLMVPMSETAHVVALDLPGIGGSQAPPPSNDKLTLAKYIRGLIAALELENVTLVGRDVGGMIAYAYLHAYPDELERAVIMNTAVPGVAPWAEVVRNPHIWHFAFHAIPELPEKLVTGRQADYFAFFYDAISARPGAVGDRTRKTYVEAYARPEALHTGFEWYRALPQDEKDNLRVKGEPVRTPVLYLRGDHENGELEHYLGGLRESGLTDVRGRLIPDSGHFAPDEQPEAVVEALLNFLELPSPVGARHGRPPP